MESKRNIPEFTMPEELQSYMFSHANDVLNYLEEIAKINGEFFSAALKGSSNHILKGNQSSGRLFYEAKIYTPTGEEKEKSQQQLIQERMDKFFKDEKLLDYMMQKIKGLDLVLDDKNLLYVKNLVDALFKPIEQSKEWKEFYQKLDNKKQADELLDIIKGAFAYKVIGSIPHEKREPGKDKFLAKIFAKYPNTEAAISEYTTKIHDQINDLKKDLFRKIEEINSSTSKEVKEGHEKYLTDVLKNLEKNIQGILEKPEFTSLGSAKRMDILMSNVFPMLYEIKNELSKIRDEKLLKEYQIELVENFVKLVTEQNQKGELNVDWIKNPKLMSLADFAVKHKPDFHKFFVKQHEKTFGLLERQIEVSQRIGKERYFGEHPSPLFSDKTQSEEKKKGPDQEPPSYKG